MGLKNNQPLRHVENDYFILDFKFTTVGANPVAVYDPNYGTDMAFSRTGAGVYTVTFAGMKKPYKIRSLAANPQGNKPNLFAKAEYDATTGVITVRVFQNAAGTISAADDAGAVINVICCCTNHS